MNAPERWIRLDDSTFDPSTVEVYKSDATRIWIKQGGKPAPVLRHSENRSFFPTIQQAKAFIDARVAEILANAATATTNLNKMGA